MDSVGIFVLLLSQLSISRAATVDLGNLPSVNKLYNDLRQSYNKNIVPQYNITTPVKVNMTFHLLSIQEFDEVAGKLSVIAYFTVMWYEPRMTWNGWEYDHTYVIRMPPAEVWKPTITLVSPFDKISTIAGDFTSVMFISDGLAMWYPGDLLSNSCDVDVTNFPFDTQTCIIVFNCWGYIASEIEMRSPVDKIDMDEYHKHGTWDLVNTKITSSFPNGVSNVEVRITLRRRPAFMITTILAPILCVLTLNILVFILPVECGERVSFTITTLLALAVFLTLVGDNLPKTSEPMSILSYFLLASLALSTFSCFMTVISVYYYYIPDYKSVPMCIQQLVGTCTCVKKIRIENASGTSNGATPGIYYQEKEKYQQDVEEKYDYRYNISWQDLSNFIDKCMILLNSVGLLVIITTFCILTLAVQ